MLIKAMIELETSLALLIICVLGYLELLYKYTLTHTQQQSSDHKSGVLYYLYSTIRYRL